MIPAPWLSILKTVCDLPTAPLREEHVMAWITAFVGTLSPPGELQCRFDRAGNLRIDHVVPGAPDVVPAVPDAPPGGNTQLPRNLVFEAHVDHPGFITAETISESEGLLRAEFRGGVKPSCFSNAGVRLLYPDGDSPWSAATVAGEPRREEGSEALSCMLKLQTAGRRIPGGTIGMWDLPDASVSGEYFAARACDDLAGAAAMVCMLDEVCRRGIRRPLSLLFTRGEEIGFLGAIAAVEDGTLAAPGGSADWSVIGLENSRALPQVALGRGPVVRVGDRTSIFSSPLTRFIKLCADDLAESQPEFQYQRALMDGGTCNSTVFDAMGYDAAGMTLPMAHYHNMLADEAVGPPPPPRTGGKIASEMIHLRDFANLVELMLMVVSRFDSYTGDHDGLREQLQNRLDRYRDQLYTPEQVHRKTDG